MGEQEEKKEKVLFLCTHNAARSQMAEGLMNALYGDRFEAHSAGTEPTEVSPYAVAVMKELGIDIASQHAKSVKHFLGETFDYVITICDQAKENCPFFPGAKERMHRGFEDPAQVQDTAAETVARFRRIRDEIGMWLAETFGGGPARQQHTRQKLENLSNDR